MKGKPNGDTTDHRQMPLHGLILGHSVDPFWPVAAVCAPGTFFFHSFFTRAFYQQNSSLFTFSYISLLPSILPMSAFDYSQWSYPNLSTVSHYPALTVGISLFTFALLLVDLGTGHSLAHKFSLFPLAPIKFDLNRISFYLLFHQGLIHWALNVAGLFTPLSIFEKTHGTVYTGITLNLLAVTAALQYSLVGLLLFPHTHVIGLSGVVFSFFSFFAYKEHQLKPVIYTFKLQGREYSIPTLYSPFVALLVTLIILPGSSFFGHLAGISSGYLLAMDKLKILYPPSKVILWIENKLAGPIGLLDGVVVYYKEQDSVDARGISYTPILTQDEESGSTQPFVGSGHVLGQ